MRFVGRRAARVLWASLLSVACVVPVGADELQPGLLRDTVPVLEGGHLFHSQRALERFLDAAGCDVGYYAVQPVTGLVLAREADREVCLAGMSKVFCLTELFRRAEEGLGIDTVSLAVSGRGRLTLRETAALMAGDGDRHATEALTAFLGLERVNAIPGLLGIEGLSADVMVDDPKLRSTLDLRLDMGRVAERGLPQHGTARAIATYYEKLWRGKVISPAVSQRLRDFLAEHSQVFSADYRDAFVVSGKGGSILWTRPPYHYAMSGWGQLLSVAEPASSPARSAVALCVWAEWFPQGMTAAEQRAFLERVSDSLVAILESPRRAAKQAERAGQIQQL